MNKFEFASPRWMDAVRERFTHYAAAAGPDLEFSICEVFTGVPKHLDRCGNGTIAWHCKIKSGHVEFRETAISDADVHTTADYEFLLPVARRIFTPDVMPEIHAYLDDGVATGKMIPRSRDRSKIPGFFIQLHNDLAVMLQ